MKRLFLTIIGTFAMLITASAQILSFKADINSMSPMSYPAQTGLTDFYFQLDGDTADIYLPYMGEVYAPAFNSDGLNFRGKCNDLKVVPNKKKNGREITFSIKNDIVDYRFCITLFDNGTTYIYVRPSNAQGCSYTGTATFDQFD